MTAEPAHVTNTVRALFEHYLDDDCAAIHTGDLDVWEEDQRVIISVDPDLMDFGSCLEPPQNDCGTWNLEPTQARWLAYQLLDAASAAEGRA
jgi:hypothetical protein